MSFKIPIGEDDEGQFSSSGDFIFASYLAPTPTLGGGEITLPPLTTGTDPGSSDSGPGSVVAVTSGGFTVNLLYDAKAMAAPQSFRDGIQQAASLLAAAISDKITININIDYSGTGGGAASGPDIGQFVSYSTVRADLIANATVGDTIFNALPTGSSIQGQTNVAVWNAQLKLWGLLSPNDTTTDDGSATFATDINPNLLVGVALHELTHAMGRVPYGPQPDIFDFFRFNSAGTRLFQGGDTAPAAYFSANGGTTDLADFGLFSDPSDFLNPGPTHLGPPYSSLTPNDAFNELYNNSTTQTLTPIDKEILDAIGFHTLGPANQASPVVTDTNGANISATHGQVFQLSSLFTATDPQNKPLNYELYDATAGANTGHLKINGVTQAEGQWIGVTQAQLAQTTFTAGQNGVTDVIYMIADDGTLQGYNSVSVAAANHAPVVTDPNGASVSEAHSLVVSLSALITASDPDGDAMSYALYDATPGANTGHININGVAQAEGQWISVSQAQLNLTTFTTSATGASDAIYMIASDGSLQGFNSVSVVAAADHAPFVVDTIGSSYSATHGQVLQLSQMFFASDPDGDPMSYALYDSASGTSPGHLSINGATQTAGHWIAVTQAQLSSISFTAGQGGSSDTIIMIADDGTLQGYNSMQISVAVGATGLVASQPDASVTASASPLLHSSPMFAANDPGAGGFNFNNAAPAAVGVLAGAMTPPDDTPAAPAQPALGAAALGLGIADHVAAIGDDGSHFGVHVAAHDFLIV